jgi:ATPase subunit of ABC transporter with duplicated ATPase domains
MSERSLLSAYELQFDIGEEVLFRDVFISISGGDRIGLVGRNGSGKSTLLKVLAGRLSPIKGRIHPDRRDIFYLPQIDLTLFTSDTTIESYVGNFDSDWHAVRANFNRLFGPALPTGASEIRNLSGGELVKLHIAIMDSHIWNLYLLDEPTNHLDMRGLETLSAYLRMTKKPFVIVSHDPLFLDKIVNRIWELDNGVLSEFGGTYQEYAKQKDFERNSRERTIGALEKSLKKAKLARQTEETRQSRSEREGRKQSRDRSMSAYERGFFAERASKSAGRQSRKIDKIIQHRTEEVVSLKERRKRQVSVQLTSSAQKQGRALISIEDGTLFVGDNVLIEGLTLKIRGGDRIVLLGPNGSGKSALASSLIHENPRQQVILKGIVRRAEALNAMYIDQKYAVVDPGKSAYQNVQTSNPHLSYGEIRQQLARFLFFEEPDVGEKASLLSGGEVARLALAMATANRIELLILDEPTNNLDIETLENIAKALTDFSGAIFVISHNMYFLEQLNIETAYAIQNRIFSKVPYPVDQTKDL